MNTQNITPEEPVQLHSELGTHLKSYLENQVQNKSYFIETHGCQMNVSDSEIVAAIMEQAGYQASLTMDQADVLLVNTCAIRENAEQKIWNKLTTKYQAVKVHKPGTKIGVLGCMAERVKEKMLDHKVVDLVAGPDAYRDLPRLLNLMGNEDAQAMNVQLSQDETYADILPVRTSNKLHAWISIMRGCNNMCSFCIVPFVRGRERNRPAYSIIDEVKQLRDQGIREITLLGQNVNSYHDIQTESSLEHLNSEGFQEMYKSRKASGLRFAELLDQVAEVAPEVRFRFTSPHPKDFPDPLLDVIANRANVCKQIHIPCQSGSTDMLMRMRRNHTREAYINLIERMRQKIPGVALSTDFIVGFCDETEAEFQETLSMLEIVKYDLAFLFAYSMREKTHAHRRMVDSVPEDVKQDRLVQMINTFKRIQLDVQKAEIGKKHLVLVDGNGKKGINQLSGLTDTMKRGVFENPGQFKIGDMVLVEVTDATQNTLFCQAIKHMSVTDYFNQCK